MVVGRQVAAVVVAHDDVDELRLRALLREVGDEAAHVVRDLLGDAGAAVAGILVLRERGPLQVPDLVRLALVAVRHARLQAVDVGPPRFEAEVPEHVVERPVLEHEHDDVVDLAEVGEGRVGRGRHVGRRASRPSHGQKRSVTWSATSFGRFFSAASASTKWPSSDTVSGSRVKRHEQVGQRRGRGEAVHHRRQVAVRAGEMRPLIDAVAHPRGRARGTRPPGSTFCLSISFASSGNRCQAVREQVGRLFQASPAR